MVAIISPVGFGKDLFGSIVENLLVVLVLLTWFIYFQMMDVAPTFGSAATAGIKPSVWE